MLRLLLIPMLLACAFAVPLSALETPLTLASPNGVLCATVNPSLGTMTMYRLNGVATLDRVGSANFLNDVAFLERYIVADRGEDVFSALRVGYGLNKPTPEEWLGSVLGALKNTRAAGDAGIMSLEKRARNSELDFWAKENPYDGVVRAALGDAYLMLVIPAKRAVMFYDVQNEGFKLVAVTNFGPLLYLPHVYNSTPTPSELIKQLPSDIQEERRKQMEDQMVAMLEEPGQTIQVKPSDIWVASAVGEKFLVFDIANLQLMSYEYAGKNLVVNAVRNIEVDLMIPSAYKSQPDLQGMYQQFRNGKDNKAFLEGEAINDLIELEAYVQSQQSSNTSGGGASKASSVQPTVIAKTGDLIVDFTDQRKVISYRFGGGNTVIELRSMRDYTLDAGIALIEAEIANRRYGAQFLEQAKKQRNPALAMRLVQSALKMYPPLYQVVEKDSRLVKNISAQPEYAAAIEDAIAKTKAAADAREARIAAAKERREKNAEAGAGRR